MDVTRARAQRPRRSVVRGAPDAAGDASGEQRRRVADVHRQSAGPAADVVGPALGPYQRRVNRQARAAAGERPAVSSRLFAKATSRRRMPRGIALARGSRSVGEAHLVPRPDRPRFLADVGARADPGRMAPRSRGRATRRASNTGARIASSPMATTMTRRVEGDRSSRIPIESTAGRSRSASRIPETSAVRPLVFADSRARQQGSSSHGTTAAAHEDWSCYGIRTERAVRTIVPCGPVTVARAR